jgi:hypothetical protein
VKIADNTPVNLQSLLQRLVQPREGEINMKRTVWTIVFIAFFFGTMFTGCARQEQDSEPGVIESFTEETADEITTSIKRPLNKARSVKNSSQNRMKNLDDMANE